MLNAHLEGSQSAKPFWIDLLDPTPEEIARVCGSQYPAPSSFAGIFAGNRDVEPLTEPRERFCISARRWRCRMRPRALRQYRWDLFFPRNSLSPSDIPWFRPSRRSRRSCWPRVSRARTAPARRFRWRSSKASWMSTLTRAGEVEQRTGPCSRRRHLARRECLPKGKSAPRRRARCSESLSAVGTAGDHLSRIRERSLLGLQQNHRVCAENGGRLVIAEKTR